VEGEADWLCFVDADVWAEPALVASAIAAANAGALDLLSLAPRQELQSFAERLVMTSTSIWPRGIRVNLWWFMQL
jgi:hypothetical protein